jgi:hypothetical protein
MNMLEKSSARKNTKISFRTDEITLSKLKAVCRIENKTVSSLIEDVLTEYVLCQEAPLSYNGEKRQCPRKQCSISGVIFSKSNGRALYSNSTIVNLSLSSMQIIVKTAPQDLTFEEGFKILFSLPNQEHPLLIQCDFVRANRLRGESMIVAQFECENDQEKDMLQHFLQSTPLPLENTNKKKQR